MASGEARFSVPCLVLVRTVDTSGKVAEWCRNPLNCLRLISPVGSCSLLIHWHRLCLMSLSLSSLSHALKAAADARPTALVAIWALHSAACVIWENCSTVVNERVDRVEIQFTRSFGVITNVAGSSGNWPPKTRHMCRSVSIMFEDLARTFNLHKRSRYVAKVRHHWATGLANCGDVLARGRCERTQGLRADARPQYLNRLSRGMV